MGYIRKQAPFIGNTGIPHYQEESCNTNLNNVWRYRESRMMTREDNNHIKQQPFLTKNKNTRFIPLKSGSKYLVFVKILIENVLQGPRKHSISERFRLHLLLAWNLHHLHQDSSFSSLPSSTQSLCFWTVSQKTHFLDFDKDESFEVWTKKRDKSKNL